MCSITDAATARGVLRADGGVELDRRLTDRQAVRDRGREPRQFVKKFINEPDVVVEEMLEGAIRAHRAFIRPIASSRRALVALDGPRPGKVGLVVGGGSGHEPCFLGYVGKGLADAVAVGNVFSTPPPDPIFQCAQAVSGGAGVLFVYGNYVGDVMNFDMAAEIARDQGIETRSIMTTDDVASSPRENRDSRRGVAGNLFVFKVAGAACDKGWSLDICEAVTRKANARTYTVGVALEPCSLPQTRRYNFEIGPNEIEIGMGIHGEPGVMRGALATADEIVDNILDQIFSEMRPSSGDKVAVLVNSLGGTPLDGIVHPLSPRRATAGRKRHRNRHEPRRPLLHVDRHGRRVHIAPAPRSRVAGSSSSPLPNRIPAGGLNSAVTERRNPMVELLSHSLSRMFHNISNSIEANEGPPFGARRRDRRRRSWRDDVDRLPGGEGRTVPAQR